MSNNTRRPNTSYNNDIIYEDISILYRSCETIRRNINIIQRRFLNNTNINFSSATSFTARHLEAVRDIITTQSQMYQSNLSHIHDMYNIIDRRSRPNNMNHNSDYSGNYANINGVYYNIDNIQFGNNSTRNDNDETNIMRPEQNRNQDSQSPISVTEPSLNENNQTEEPARHPRRNTRQRNGGNRRVPREQSSRFLRERPGGHNRVASIQNRFISNLPNVLRQPIGSNLQPPNLERRFGWNNIFNNNGLNPNIFNSGRSTWENIATDFLQNLSNVPVFPSRNDIDNATREINIESHHITCTPRCPISWEPFEIGNTALQIIPCGHIFHTESLQRWFQSSVRCPLCRYDIREYNPPDTNNTTNVTQTNEQTNNQENILQGNETNEINETNETTQNEETQENTLNTDGDDQPRNTPPLPTPLSTPPTSDNNQTPPTTNHLNMNQDVNNIMNLFTQLSLNETSLNGIPNQRNRQEQTQQTSNNQTETNPNTSIFNIFENEIQSSIGNEIMHNFFTNNINNLSVDPSTNEITFETIVGISNQDINEVD